TSARSGTPAAGSTSTTPTTGRGSGGRRTESSLMRLRGIAVAVAALLVSGASAVVAPAHAAVPSPVVKGPITGGLHGHALFDSWFNLADIGYEEAEYFVSGTAKSLDGTKTAPFTTRMIV